MVVKFLDQLLGRRKTAGSHKAGPACGHFQFFACGQGVVALAIEKLHAVLQLTDKHIGIQQRIVAGDIEQALVAARIQSFEHAALAQGGSPGTMLQLQELHQELDVV